MNELLHRSVAIKDDLGIAVKNMVFEKKEKKRT